MTRSVDQIPAGRCLSLPQMSTLHKAVLRDDRSNLSSGFAESISGPLYGSALLRGPVHAA